MPRSIETKNLSRTYGNGRGWAFSEKDFARLGSPESIHLALHRLQKKGTIRRILQRLYDSASRCPSNIRNVTLQM